MEILNYSERMMEIMKNYLSERRQFTHIDGYDSDILTVGNKSVTQGSTMSCGLYLLYILDIPQICHNISHSPAEYRMCAEPNILMFIDDNYVKIVNNGKDGTVSNQNNRQNPGLYECQSIGNELREN